MSTLVWRRFHSERWGGSKGVSTGMSSGSSPIPTLRTIRLKIYVYYIRCDQRHGINQVHLHDTPNPPIWNSEHFLGRDYNEVSGFRRGFCCICIATRVAELIALRISPADISTMDWRRSLGTRFNDGIVWRARIMIVFAMGLNLLCIRQPRVEIRYVWCCRMI